MKQMHYGELKGVWDTLKAQVETNVQEGKPNPTWEEIQSLIELVENKQEIKSAMDDCSLSGKQFHLCLDILQAKKSIPHTFLEEIRVIGLHESDFYKSKNPYWIALSIKTNIIIEFKGKNLDVLLNKTKELVLSQPDHLTPIEACNHLEAIYDNNQTNLDQVKDWSAFWTQTS